MSRISLAVSLLMLVLFSCEDGYLTDCRSCFTELPGNVTIEIRFRNNDRVPQNPLVTIYEGAVEDGMIIDRYYVQDPYSYLSYDALLYKDYSATLEFSYNGKKYITTAAACPKVRYDESSCDQPCYYIYDNVLDLRLRYE
jgi:hypothetical protein